MKRRTLDKAERDMFDTMTLTKVIGGFCGMLLGFLLGHWGSEELYHVGGKGHGDHHDLAYVILEEDDHGGDEEPEEVVDFATVFAAADAAAGEGEFRGCKACHNVEDGKNGAGPHLYGVVGRSVASVDGFGYSGNLVKVVETWTPEELNLFLENPKGYAPGTKMNYKGIKDVEDRANLIAWLDSLDD